MGMVVINITTDEGVLCDRIERVEDFDLTKPLARAALLHDITVAIEQAKQTELEAPHA